MIDRLRIERESLDREIQALRKAIAGYPRPCGPRLNFKILLNKALVARQRVHRQIVKQETIDDMTRVIREVSGLDEAQAQKLQADLEGLEALNVNRDRET